MSMFVSEPSVYRSHADGRTIVFENEYGRWVHDRESGQLIGAFVTHGSGENLLRQPLESRIFVSEGGKPVCYVAGSGKAVGLQWDERSISFEQAFVNAEGGVLSGVRCRLSVRYGQWGEAVHGMDILLDRPLDGLQHLMPVCFSVRSDMEFVGIRDRMSHGWGYWGQNGMRWHRLHGGKTFDDQTPYLSNAVPLSVEFVKLGCEGIQFELADDLECWEPFPGYQEGALIYDASSDSFALRLATCLDMQQVRLDHSLHLSYRLSLPFVRKQIVPLRRASGLLYYTRGFADRWPTSEDFGAMKAAGYDLLRLHCDGDSFHTGVFWRDACYPPFPPEDMKRMDACIQAAHEHGIHVVPYFSVKEMHPDAEGYAEHVTEWVRRSVPTYPIKVSQFGTVMCLGSGWREKRRSSIEEPLSKHGFDGIYYDWCAGIECANGEHCGHVHWDNDALLEHLTWTWKTFKEQSERYLHLTFVSSLAVENASTMTITEESVFPQVSPTMFSPHVHFMNIAPRQICDMLPVDSDEVTRLRLAMCALLHHATVSSLHPVYLRFYASLDWLDRVTHYTRHTAPGEGLMRTSSPDVGGSAYWNQDDVLVVLANLSDTDREVTYELHRPGWDPIYGTAKVPALQVVTVG